MKQHVFHRLAEIFFSGIVSCWGQPYNFIKTAKIFSKMMQFFTKYTYSVGFSFMWWGIFGSIEWPEKNIKIFKIEKMATVFLKILQTDFLERATFKFFYLFLVDCRLYGIHILQVWLLVNNFFLLKKTFFEKKSKLLIFSKTTLPSILPSILFIVYIKPYTQRNK